MKICMCACRIAQEREIHRKISTGSAMEPTSLAEPQLSTVHDGEEDNQAKGGDFPTSDPPGHTAKEADGLKVEDTTPATAGNESKEGGASDVSSTPAVGKADVEAGEANKVGQSGVQVELEEAKVSDHTAEDTPHQHSADHKVDDEAATEAEPPEGSKDPVAVSSEPTRGSAVVRQHWREMDVVS